MHSPIERERRAIHSRRASSLKSEAAARRGSASDGAELRGEKTTPALRRASVRRSSRSLVLRLRGLARLSRLVALLVTRLAVLSRGKLADFLRRVRHVLLHVLDRLVDDRLDVRFEGRAVRNRHATLLARLTTRGARRAGRTSRTRRASRTGRTCRSSRARRTGRARATRRGARAGRTSRTSRTRRTSRTSAACRTSGAGRARLLVLALTPERERGDRVERRVQRVAHLVVVFADDFADSLVVDILTTAEVEKLLVADLVLSAEELVGRVALRDDGRLALLT